jgi:hypothetical protein
MCSPTLAVTAISAGSSFIQYQQAKQQQKAEYNRAKQQNALAKKNALQRYASEQLRIRQEAKQSSQKGFEATLKTRKKVSEFEAERGSSGIALSGSTLALMNDYYRTEAKYKNSLANNLAINISQFERNLEAIQFGQEAQSTYVQPPNPELLFASSALNVANTYYSLEFAKQQNGLLTNRDKNNQINSVSSGAWI